MTEAIQLRDGSTATDPRLDRLIHFDPRSRDYPIREVVRTYEPVRTKVHPLRVRLDQRRQGACVLFAWTHEACATPVPAFNLGSTRTEAESVVPAAEQFAREQYWEAQKIDEWPGGSYPGASPQYEGTSVLAGAKVMQAAGYLGEYRWCFGIDDLLRTLSNFGPVVAGTWWLSGMWETDGNGVLDVSGSREGGHAYLLRGVHVPYKGYVTTAMGGRRVRIKTDVPLLRSPNSWNRSWGIDGECLIPADQFETHLLLEDGEACVPVERFRVR